MTKKKETINETMADIICGAAKEIAEPFISKNAMATLEQLIKKKLEKDGKREATKEIFVKSLNANITVKSPSDTQKIEFFDKTKTGSYADMMAAYEKLIYDCCPMLHSKELQESIEIQYPYDTVKAIFDIDEITDIGPKVLNFFDDDEENNADEKLKNS